MLITVFGNYFSFFSEALFRNPEFPLIPSEALHNICELGNPEGAQQPTERGLGLAL